MSTDAPAAPPRKKRHVWRWVGLAVLLFLAWFCWQLFGPNPPIIVSRETTYITEPLRPDGLPDYKQYLLDEYRAGVTPENNAAVLLWQALGVRGGLASPDDLEAWATEFGMSQVPAEKDVLSPLYGQATRQAIADWLNSRNGSDAAQNKAITWKDDEVEQVIDEAMEHPWASKQLPPLADWLRKHQKQIELLVEASERNRWYWPFMVVDGEESEGNLLFVSTEGLGLIRNAARVLEVRAMWNLGEGRIDEGTRDIIAMFRLAHVISQQGMLTDQLVGIAIEGMAADAALKLIGDESLSVDQTVVIFNEFDAQPAFDYMSNSFDYSERVWLLNALVLSRKGGIGDFLSGLGTGEDLINKPMNFISVDWNVVLRQTNQCYDDIAAASRNPDWSQRQNSFEQVEADISELKARSTSSLTWTTALFSEQRRSELLAGFVASELITPFTAAKYGEDRANTELALIRLAAALAVYRAEQGEYPESLEALVPDVLPEVPVDLYHEKPYIYQRDGEGYLLYSAGPNGRDDGGSNELYGEILAGRVLGYKDDPETNRLREQIPKGADDIAIRVPVPPFKLPEPREVAPGR